VEASTGADSVTPDDIVIMRMINKQDHQINVHSEPWGVSGILLICNILSLVEVKVSTSEQKILYTDLLRLEL
jgi:hypothetical protein